MRPSCSDISRRPCLRRSRSRPRGFRRGLSLVELLLAVFILAIGVISVAAIFPAAIFVQRQSTDDTLGPIVADNAMAVLRQRLRQEDFGPLAPFYPPNSVPALLPFQAVGAPTASLAGDWGWRRPAYVIAQPSMTIDGIDVANGSMVIFRPAQGPTNELTYSELPWNPLATAIVTDPSSPQFLQPAWYGAFPPTIVIRTEDRIYPLGAAAPQYRWEVLFRRFQGRVLAAIFVYRVTRAGGEGGGFRVGPASAPLSTALPSFPIGVALADLGLPVWTAGGADGNVQTLADNAVVPGIVAGNPFAIDNPLQAWQAPGQWLLDQNNNVHRVLRGRKLQSDGAPVLARPLPLIPALPAFPPVPNGDIDAPRVVQAIWYLPARDAAGNTITPVFVTVREL
ncbi:MAG TPA: hypothetical protein PKC43_04160 [Phycisphaerales bacterium]|nr:hypothetical protein [Phycisphaerales bacterium]HMP36621.1 hypothetical protein [Phycisphaerales bacterium]